MNISTRQLKGFLYAAKHQSFSRAADQMFITQSGLSAMIGELEKQVGFRLFDRTTRSVELTENGRKFMILAERSLANLEAGLSDIASLASGGRTLTVAATPLTASYFLPRIIAHFQAQQPPLFIKVIDTELTRIFEMLTDSQVDVGLGMFIKENVGVKRSALFKFSLLAIRPITEEHGKRFGRTTWKSLANETLIGLQADNPMQQLVATTMLKLGRREPADITANYIDTMIGMVEAGMGVSVVPSFALPACQARSVSIDWLMDPKIELEFYEIRKRGRVLHSGAEEFLKRCREEGAHMEAAVGV